METATSVDENTWEVVGVVAATGRTAALDDPNGMFDEQRFYRVQQSP